MGQGGLLPAWVNLVTSNVQKLACGGVNKKNLIDLVSHILFIYFIYTLSPHGESKLACVILLSSILFSHLTNGSQHGDNELDPNSFRSHKKGRKVLF